MEQKEIIKLLKELSVAHKCALAYDSVPDATKVDRILKQIVDYDRGSLIEILNKYSGWSCGDIESETFDYIDKL